ncbi:MAG: CdaR family protein [Lentisphaeria bacterium]|jgi:hypothetical protein|nr:CdaR family protein [Lentisphaeria bacterium]MDY0176376.1 CdaR family protein [Lentisphaeria bacterium]NLZ59606.1 hypothetical protein [Lentisphaerota bacterium]
MYLSHLKNKLHDLGFAAWTWLRNDIWRKSVALALGLLCWYFIAKVVLPDNLASRETITIKEIELNSSSKDLYVPSGQEFGDIKLRLAIDLSARNRAFSANDFRIVIDPAEAKTRESTLAQGEPNSYLVTLSDEDIEKKPAGVKVISFSPKAIPIKWENIDTQFKDLNVPVQGRLRPGFTYKLKLSPSRVKVTGPASQVNSLLVVDTETLLLNENIGSDFSTTLNVFSPDSSTMQLNFDSVDVDVQVTDTKSISSWKLPKIPLSLVIRPNSGLNLQNELPGSVETVIRGQIIAFESLDQSRLKAVLDLSSFNSPGVYRAEVNIIGLGSDLKADYIEPSICEVSLVNAKDSENTPEDNSAQEKNNPVKTPEAAQ